jgi:hypothetical protein
VTDERLREAFEELPVVTCPPAVLQRIAAAIADEKRNAPARRPTTIRRLTWAAPLATAAALAVVLLATRPDPAPQYSPAEVAAARTQAVESLSTVMTMIQRTQREAVTEVLGRQVPGTLRTSVQKALQMSEGGQG